MPVYQYRGIECGHEFERRQSFSDDALTECEVCGKPVRRVIHASPIVFKGTGWYITDTKPTHDAKGGVQDPAKSGTGGSGESISGEPPKPAETKTKTETKDSAPAKPKAD